MSSARAHLDSETVVNRLYASKLGKYPPFEVRASMYLVTI